MLAGERWKEDLCLATGCALQGVTRGQLSAIVDRLHREETVGRFLETAHEYFKTEPHPLADAV